MRVEKRTIFAVALIATAACSRTSQFAAIANPHIPNVDRPRAPSKLTEPSSFYWPGIYDLVGTGFQDGERRAVMHIRRSDTSYVLIELEGPPGELLGFDVAGDSAHVIWDMSGAVMVVDLHGVRDSVYGKWSIGERSGDIYGARRPYRSASRRSLMSQSTASRPLRQ